MSLYTYSICCKYISPLLREKIDDIETPVLGCLQYRSAFILRLVYIKRNPVLQAFKKKLLDAHGK